MLPLLLLAAALTAPPDGDAALRAGLDEGAQVLMSSPDPDVAAAAQAWLAVGDRRARVHEVELRILKSGVENALLVDDLPRAAGLLAASLGALPTQPDLLELRDTVEQAMVLARPEDRAQAWIELAGVCRDPVLRATWLARSDRAALELRYAPEQRAVTLAAQQGIRRDDAVAMLERIGREYYTKPDWLAATAAGSRQLGWLVEVGMTQASDVPPPHKNPAKALDGALAWGTAAGLPSETVIAEWMHGTLAALDGWTRAVWPAELASWQEQHEGVYYGVGLALEAGAGGEVRVARPLLDSPAWTSGIHQGDTIERIGDLVLAEVEGDRVAAAERALRGPAGSAVTLRLARRGQEPFEVALTRAGIGTQTVYGYRRRDDNALDPWLDEDDGLVYVRIDAFDPQTEAAFDALTLPVADRLQGVILDLRGNPGGDIGSAVQIADRFVAEGALIEISGRVMPETSGPDFDPVTGARLPDWNEGAPGHALEGVPVVLLVDTGTASAAELLAGALQTRAGGWVVGAPTWGKGRTQALRVGPDQRWAVQYSNLVWTLPDGRTIDRDLGGGIEPDVALSLSVGEQYLARRLASQRDAVRHHADGTPLRPEELRRRWDLPDLDVDPGLLAAELVLRTVLAESP